MTEINVTGFAGANNVKIEEAFYIKKGIAQPRVILNADVDIVGRLSIRSGKTLFLTLANSHSLWANKDCMLCASNGVLYRIESGTKISISNISGPEYPLSYSEVNDKVYISNPYWQGIFDPLLNSASAWGIPRPPGPMLLVGNGNLSAGIYHVCMTTVSGEEISGNGEIATIEIAENTGIRILNRPNNAIVWVTDANESIFYYVGPVDTIVDITSIEPLPTFLCSPPPFLENLCYAFGRMWGSSKNVLYYSEPHNLSLFKLNQNRFEFDSDISLIARTSGGLYVGTDTKTKFLAGNEPSQMQQIDVGEGSIRGTLAYCQNMPELGWTLGTAEKDFNDVPVWLTMQGIVVGNPTGKVFNITKNKIQIDMPESGASLYRSLNGVFQFLTSFKQGRVKGDTDTLYSFEHGKIPSYSTSSNGPFSMFGFTEDVSCKVFRDGVEI